MIDPLSQYSFEFLFWFFVPKLFVASVCGGLIGWERKTSNKLSKIRTNVLICASSTLFTATSILLCDAWKIPDATRIIANIVTGIGFLGTGIIFKQENQIVGLTTATFIWAMGALGMVIGSGGLMIGFILTLGLMSVSLLFSWLEGNIEFKIHDKTDNQP